MAPAVVRLHRLAARDYQAAQARYAAHSPAAGQRFQQEIRNVILRIAAAPDQGAIYRGPYRWMRPRRYPYVLYYELIDPTQVLIYAIAHARRRPGYWLRRTRHP